MIFRCEGCHARLPAVLRNRGKGVHHGRTGRQFYKEPTLGQVQLRKLNLDGDRQADLTVQGDQTFPIAIRLSVVRKYSTPFAIAGVA